MSNFAICKAVSLNRPCGLSRLQQRVCLCQCVWTTNYRRTSPIEVYDFEMDVITSQSPDRCVVAIKVNGEPKKFFTDSKEMKNILQQIKKQPDGFPFTTILKSESFGQGKTKYIFT